MLNFFSLSSGSSGNCYYVGNESSGILIDAGISASNIRKFLSDKGISIKTVMGVLITHNHSDHVRGIEVLARRNSIPVFTTSMVWKSILKPKSKLSKDLFREIYLQEKFRLASFEIEAFPVSHDAPETIGFHICSGEQKITIVTDLGHICNIAAPYIKAARLLVIESNYDEQMLLNGNYPYFLKNRIMSDKGHLGNHQTSAFLADNISGNLQYVCLAHLSKNNNTPELALRSLSEALLKKDFKLNGSLRVSVLNRNLPSDILKLEG